MHETQCPICRSNARSVVSRGNGFALVKCGGCGLVMKSVSDLTRAKVQELQDSVYTEVRTRAQVSMTRRMAKDRLRVLAEFADRGRLLEIGCATGEFIELAGASGFEALGLDASERYASYAAARGLNVRGGRLEDLDPEEAPFDVIAGFHVIEHIEAPAQFLERLHVLVKPGGVLFFVTPNVESLTNRPFGYRHPNFRQADHLFFYSPKTLPALLSGTGFEVLRVSTKEYPHHLFTSLVALPSILFSARGRKPVAQRSRREEAEQGAGGFCSASEDGARAHARRMVNRLAHLCGYVFYPVLRPYGVIVEKRMRGHELIAVARKPPQGFSEARSD